MLKSAQQQRQLEAGEIEIAAVVKVKKQDSNASHSILIEHIATPGAVLVAVEVALAVRVRKQERRQTRMQERESTRS